MVCHLKTSRRCSQDRVPFTIDSLTIDIVSSEDGNLLIQNRCLDLVERVQPQMLDAILLLSHRHVPESIGTWKYLPVSNRASSSPVRGRVTSRCNLEMLFRCLSSSRVAGGPMQSQKEGSWQEFLFQGAVLLTCTSFHYHESTMGRGSALPG